MHSLFTTWILSTAIAAPQEVGVALRQGNCSIATEYTPSAEEWNYQLAIGKCLIELGQIDRAAALLLQVPEPWTGHAELYQAQGTALIQQHTKAIQLSQSVLERPNLSPELKASASLILARSYIAEGAYLKARDLLRPLLTPKRTVDGYIPAANEIDPAEVRWLLAEGARLRGSTTSSIPVYWRIWMSNPTSIYAQFSEEKLIELGERIPNSTTETGRAQIKRRAKTLRKLQLHKAALELLDRLPVPTTEKEQRTYAYYVFSAKDYPRAVKLLSVLETPTDRDLYHLAVGSVRSGDYNASARYYRKLLKHFPTSKWADISSYKLGYLEYDRGNLELAIPLFQEHLKQRPQSKYADEARYFIGWSMLKLGQLEPAKSMFTEVQTKHFKSSLAAGAAFWHAYILQEQGEVDKAKQGFQYVVTTWPTSGYAWQSGEYIEISYPTVEQVSLNVAPYTQLPSILDVSEFHTARLLAEVGFESLATNTLRPLKDVVKGNKQAQLLLAHALIESGSYREAQALARPYCVKPQNGGDPLAQQACYPKPHREIVESVIGEHSLDPNLPFAIMTAESALQPTVSSPVGARGMMQLMPYVAEELHPLLFQNQPFDPDTLFQSGYNVSLGTRELMKLSDNMNDLQLNNPLPMVIAGYNGGEEAVRRWMGLYSEEPTVAAFSDDIGYSETRRYNRRVLGYVMTYRYVYGE